jgi:four helix bundle protein
MRYEHSCVVAFIASRHERRHVGDYTHLTVWKKSHAVTLAVYRVTTKWPKQELFGLTAQTRRAAHSIVSNIAEGCGRNSDAELARFARIALGSANELSYDLRLAKDLGYLNDATYHALSNMVDEIRRMLAALVKVSSWAATVGKRARRSVSADS